MNEHRSRRVILFDLRLMMRLRLMNDLQNAARHFRHLTVNSRPAVILKVCHVNRVVDLAVCHRELSFRVVGTALALDVLDKYVIVLNFVVGPVARTFVVVHIADLRHHHDGRNALLRDHPPEVTNGALQWILCDYERLVVVVAFDEGSIHVS